MSIPRSAVQNSESTSAVKTVVLSNRNDAKSGNNNYVPWSESMYGRFGKDHGQVGKIMQSHEPYKLPSWKAFLPEPEEDDELTEEQQGALRLDAVKRRGRMFEKMKEDNVNLFRAIYSTISEESKQILTGHGSWKACFEAEDCNDLWRICRETHFSHLADVDEDTDQDQIELNAERRFEKLHQTADMNVHQFKKRFEDAVEHMKTVGCTVPNDSKLTLRFLESLDQVRHGPMLTKIKNNSSQGIPYPQTVQKAYLLASKWIADNPARGAVPTADSYADASAFVVYSDSVIQTKKTPIPPPPNPPRKPRQPAADPLKKPAEKPFAPFAKKLKTCFRCKSKDHFIRDCPIELAEQKVEEEARQLLAVGEEDAEDDYAQDASQLMVCELDPAADVALLTADQLLTKVILDNGATNSVFMNPTLVSKLKERKRIGVVNGAVAGAPSMKVTHQGTFHDLGDVGVSRDSVANILSQSYLRDRGVKISYNEPEDFYTVTGSENSFVFERQMDSNGKKSGLYTCDIALVTTVSDNMSRYTAREVKAARQAVTCMERMGHISYKGMIDVLQGGTQSMDISPADVQRAEVIFGKSVAGLRGKTKKQVSVAATSIIAPAVTQVQQCLSLDVFFIGDNGFLLGVLAPLALSLCKHLSDRTAKCLGSAIRGFLAAAAKRNFQVREIRADGEGGIEAMRDELALLGIPLEPAGPGQHAPVVERMIQTVKSRVRAYQNTLPFVMCKLFLVWCVMFCVRSVNLQPSTTSLSKISPFEQYSGQRLDMQRDLRVSFGDYLHCTVPVTDNTMKSRTEPCVALCPTGNSTGSVKVYSIATRTIITRDQFVVLPMTDALIAYLNSLAAKEGITRRVDPVAAEDVEDDEDEEGDAGAATVAPLPEVMPIAGRADNVVPSVDQQDVVPEAGVCESASEEQTTDEVRRSRRLAGLPSENLALVMNSPADRDRAELRRQINLRSDWRDEEFAFNISVRAALRERGAEALPVMIAEMQQMLDKNVFHGVHTEKLTYKQKQAIIRSSMFLKDKYLASGEFEKFKARLVAGGNQQDKELYDNLSSPTASTTSVLTVAAIAAAELREAVTADIGGAYLNASMEPTGVLVHMVLDKMLSAILVKLDPSYAKFVNERGCIVVALDKALYGCIEAAALWYKNLTAKLFKYGFVANEYDSCVFNKTGSDGVQITIALHVDDLLITSASQANIDHFLAYLKSEYKEVKVHTGKTLNFIGMCFDFTVAGQVSVTMDNCVDDILAHCGEVTARATPATDSLFDIREAPLASEDDSKWFHTHVAKMLYLSKRVRPECLTAVSFLSTRVQCCDIDDLAKLRRLLGYLLGTRDRGITLRVGEHMTVHAYIDASYGVHSTSGKSHTGCVIVLGEAGPVYAKSGKQKIVTKSSTEAELVGLSDTASQAIHLRNFVIAQGYETGPAVLYQDNMSCMALMKRGGPGSERSRHINIRRFWVAEKVNDKEVVIEHCRTEKMFANPLTKPVQGAQFVRERRGLTNWD